MIMPTVGTLKLNPGTADKPGSGYRSAFSHANEVSEANYYKVKLDDNNILAEMTTTTRGSTLGGGCPSEDVAKPTRARRTRGARAVIKSPHNGWCTQADAGVPGEDEARHGLLREALERRPKGVGYRDAARARLA